MAFAVPAYGQDRVYDGPGTDWTSAPNWNGNDVPDTVGEDAVFQNNGAPTSVSVTTNVALRSVRFDANGPARTINLAAFLGLTNGVSNQSGVVQTININGTVMANTSLQMFGSSDFTGTQTDVLLGAGFLQILNQANATRAHVILNAGAIGIETDDGTAALGALSGTGTVLSNTSNGAIANQQLTVGGLNLSTTFAGVIGQDAVSTLSLVKDGTGTLTLTGANNYTGTTTISAGTLQVGNGGTSGRLGSGDVINNSILFFSRSDGLTVGSVISGTGSLALLNGGLTLSGANSYSGATTIQSGTLTIQNNSALGSNATGTTVGSGGALEMQGGITITEALRLFGTGVANGGALRSISGTNTVATDIVLGSSARININGALNLQGVTGNGHTLTVGGGGQGTFFGAISNLTSFIKDGTGTLTLTGANNYTGTTTISAGTLQVGNGGTSGRLGSGDVINNSILFFSRSDGLTVGSVISGTGSLALLNGGLTLSGANSYSGATTIQSGTLTIQNNSALGSNATGTTVGSGGALEMQGGITITEALTLYGTGVANGGVLRNISGTNTVATDIILGSSARININGALNLQGVTGNGHALTVGGAGQGTFFGAISNLTSFTKDGTGTLTLSGASTFSGATVVDDGTLELTATGSTGSGLIRVNNATLRVLGTRSIANNINFANGALSELHAQDGQTLTLTGTLGFASGEMTFGSAGGTGTIVVTPNGNIGYHPTGRIIVAGGTLRAGSDRLGVFTSVHRTTTVNAGATLDYDGQAGAPVAIKNLEGAGTLLNGGGTTTINAGTFSGSIRGTQSLVVGATQFAPAGTLTLSGNNDYSGSTTIDTDATLALSGTGSLSASSGVDIAAGGIFDVSGASGAVVIGNLSGNGDVVIGARDLSIANGNGTFGGVISGSGTFRQSGAGTLILAGNNSSTANFTGAVDVTGGKLAIDGSMGDVVGNTALMTLSGGALGGSGTFHGSVTIGNAALNPGNSPGTLTIAGNLALGSATILNYELGAPGTVGGVSNDLVNVGGDLTLDGTLNTIASGAGYGPGYYRLFNYGGSLTDNGVAIGTIAGALQADILTNVNGQVNVRLGGSQALQYWDGADTNATPGVAGGAGIWNNSSTNWTGPAGYAINDSWKGQVGVFAGAAGGIVTVDGTQNFEELRFETNGYQLRPQDSLARLNTTGGFSIIDVASGITADIGVTIQGAGGIDKTGAGTLILSAATSYSGATDVAAGTLRLGTGSALTDQTALTVQAGATFDLDGFQTHVGSLAGAGSVTLGAGQLNTGYDNSATLFSGTLTGTDGSGAILTKEGSGTLTLGGTVTLATSGTAASNWVKVNAGTLAISNTGSITTDYAQNFGTIDNAGTITAFTTFQTFGTAINNGNIVGNTQNFSTLDNHGTMGALQSLGGTATNYSTGTINGTVQNFASFTSTGIVNGDISNFGTVLIANQVNGQVANLTGGATVTLTGAVTGITGYLGSAGSTFDLAGFDTSVGGLTGTGAIQLGAATLTIDAVGASTFNGTISGSGGLIKAGSSTQVLNGLNNYTGATFVNGGTLALGDGGSVGGGNVMNGAAFAFEGAADRVFTNAILGSGTVTQAGSGLVTLTGANGYSGGTQVLAGALGFDNSLALGTGSVALGDGTSLRNVQGAATIALANAIQIAGGGTATLQGVDGSNTILNGAISGGTVRFGLSGIGATAFTLGTANSYGDTRIGGGVALTVEGGGSLGVGNTRFETSPIPSSLTFANGIDYSYAGVISGSGSIIVDTTAPGVSVTLTGSNNAVDNFTGLVTVDAGRLVLNGDLGDVVNNTASLTLNGGTLGGSGTFHGDVSFGNAALDPGNSPGTLTVAGNLTLGAGTILNYELGEAGTVGGANNDLVNIGENLTLDGTLNVTAMGGFGEGYYRLFNYGGSFTDNGLNLGALPAGYTPTLLTNITGQVNILFASSPQVIQYWDGSDLTGGSTASGGDGGSGVWSSANANWTAPTGYGVNDAWRGQVAVFGTSGGTVTVEGTQAFQELRFLTSGYVIGSATAADGLATTGGFSVIDVVNGADATIDAAISGTGGLTKIGAGTITLTGANTYTGLTLVSGGTLTVSATGSIAGPVRNQANFTNAGTVTGVVQNDTTLTSTGNLAGGLINNGTASLAGAVGAALANNGTVTFTGAATVAVLQQGATGNFNLAGFGVSLGALVGSGTITLGSGALSVGAGNGNSSFGGTISGAGNLTKTGNGTLALTGAATQTGGTTISGGTLQIGTGGTTGSLSGAVTNNSVLALNRSDAVTLANVMSGTGGFVQAGTGTTTLTGANSYSGGTLVSAGRLRGDSASLQGDIRIDTALEFAQTSTGTYAGSLSGVGLFDKTGIGTLVLTGNSAGFTGATHLIGGGLAVNGLLSRSIVTVSNGATLSGTGTVGGVILQSGATIAPGNSVGTFSVAGNVQFLTGSLYTAEVQAGGSDKILATGTAQLSGTLQVLNLGGNYAINSTFVLLHADAGVSGTFTTANLASFGLAYRPKIIYAANEVQLFLAANQLSAVLGTGVSLTYNQASTIGRLDAAVVTGGYDPSALSALYNLAPAAIPAALDQLSGEIYADATRAALEDERVVPEAVLGRLGEAADLGLTGNGSWGQAIGSWGSVDGDGNAAGYDVNRTGFAMGMDAGDASEEGSWRAGVTGHYTRITVPASARGSRATIDRTGGGFYAGAAMNGWRVRTGASLSLLDLKVKREIAIPGLSTTERAKNLGVMFQTFGELSYRIEMGAPGFVEPYLAGSVSQVSFGRFAESSGPVALIARAQKNVLGIAELGLRGGTTLVGGDKGGIRLGGNIGLRTAFGDRVANPVIALAAAPDQAFNVHSAAIDRFAAAANLNVTADLSDKLSLRLGYNGVLAGGAREHGARATLSLKF
ncbi:autotransporter-associated beta strand repeat-containing protein [Sphingomonas psychrotolerans]|uniref:autotransporter-associated beta strand repeat-containing protein n=1 Tax=Sphingomonas psychrotolerans TaxID=1327635 RepID=UPI0013054835|nr:autotransporter-associated beta strand repeat-containing protein [Sphingomonas psychrotolerans]